MFGYVIIDKPNILVKDYATYRSYYCGLCKRIGKNYGQAMRFTINYDIVLLSLLAHNYEKTEPVFAGENCIAHPFGKKIPVAKSNEILDRVADINTILGYYKVLDDVIDEGRHHFFKFFMKQKIKKAEKKYPDLCRKIDQEYGNLRELEKQNCLDIDMLGNCFGNIMVAVGDTITQKSDCFLRNLCYNLGKWIYFIDAIDDINEDKKENKFNPFVSKNIELNENFYNKNEPIWRKLLYTAMDKIMQNYDQMDITISEGCLSNIIYMGLKARSEKIITRRGKQCQKIRL